MSPKNFWRLPAVGVLLVGLVLGLCQPELAQAAFSADPACAAVKSGEGSAAKGSSLSFLAAALQDGVLLSGPWQSGRAPLDPTSDLLAITPSGNLLARAPPILF